MFFWLNKSPNIEIVEKVANSAYTNIKKDQAP